MKAGIVSLVVPLKLTVLPVTVKLAGAGTKKLEIPIVPVPDSSSAPWRLYNVGNHRPIEVLEVVRLIEQAVGKPAVRELLVKQVVLAPGYADLDISLQKSIPLANGAGIQLRWEVFNLLNRANFDVPNRIAFTPNFGRIFSAQPARQMQLGVKVMF